MKEHNLKNVFIHVEVKQRFLEYVVLHFHDR